ncbi:MAG: hypothetical protein WB297_04165 [Actinomycetota bacterium]
MRADRFACIFVGARSQFRGEMLVDWAAISPRRTDLVPLHLPFPQLPSFGRVSRSVSRVRATVQPLPLLLFGEQTPAAAILVLLVPHALTVHALIA